jgi:Protein of unknown function (DUF1013)
MYDQATTPTTDNHPHRTNGHATITHLTPRTPTPQPEPVPIQQLRTADTPRFTGLDITHTRTLADTETELPPILVHRPTMRIIDGMHRLNATILRGQQTIHVTYFDGTENDAFLLAVKSNTTHGLPLSTPERRAAAARIIQTHPHLSDRSIAHTTGLAAKTIATIRTTTHHTTHPTTRLGRDGRTRPLNSADGRRIAGTILQNHPNTSLRKIAKDAGISVGTARDVRERLRRGEDPTLPRHRQPPTPHTKPTHTPPTPPIDHHTILTHLHRDPTLRYTNTGRTLLHWLNQHAISTPDWQHIIPTIPPHCAIVIARIARNTAHAWTNLAQTLDQLVHDYDTTPTEEPDDGSVRAESR